MIQFYHKNMRSPKTHSSTVTHDTFILLFSFQVQFLLFGVSSNEHEIRKLFNNERLCKEKQIILCMIGCNENFITFKPYVDFCQSQDLLRIQEIEQQ